ncbi:MAG: spore coat associated protein CotJA [Lachnospiraceae bacterium]|nr:spore coat associated protein CotJA [Lachnospiraceae bacterium]
MNDPIACMPLAMAYVPWQDYEAIYSEAEAWEKGTIFCKLDLDFMARRCN